MASLRPPLAPRRLDAGPIIRESGTPHRLGPRHPYGGVVRWIIDGMNVIGTRPDGWWRDRRGAMAALVDKLEHWVEATSGESGSADVTVVFEQPLKPPIQSAAVTVAYAPRAAANSADDEIVRLVQADDRLQEIRVATSDIALSERIQAAGASVYPAATFRNVVDPF